MHTTCGGHTAEILEMFAVVSKKARPTLHVFTSYKIFWHVCALHRRGIFLRRNPSRLSHVAVSCIPSFSTVTTRPLKSNVPAFTLA